MATDRHATAAVAPAPVRDEGPRPHVPLDCRPRSAAYASVGMHVPATEYLAIRQTADQLGVSVSTLLRTAVREFLRGLCDGAPGADVAPDVAANDR